MRHLTSIFALAAFTGLALGSAGFGGDDGPDRDFEYDDEMTKDPDEDTAIEAPGPIREPSDDGSARSGDDGGGGYSGPGDIDTYAWLDASLPPCPDGTTRVGGHAAADGVPWWTVPSFRPPPGLDLGETSTADTVFQSDIEAGDMVRWCATRDGVPDGPIVFLRWEDTWQLHGWMSAGEFHGEVVGYSMVVPDQGHPVERNEAELRGQVNTGVPFGRWSLKCPIQDMNARCPIGAEVEADFSPQGRSGLWTWTSFDGVNKVTTKVRYRDDEPLGEAVVVSETVGQERQCTERGQVNYHGKQGTWNTRCVIDSKRERPILTSWKDGEPVE